MHRTRTNALLMVYVAVVVFSMGPVLVSDAEASGLVFSFWRLWIGGVIMIAAAVARIHVLKQPLPSRSGWNWAIASGIAFGLHQVFFMTALKATSVVDVTLVGTLQPLIVGVLAIRTFGERPGLSFRLWTALAMTGTAVVVVAGSAGTDGNPRGMVLAVANIVAFSVYYLLAKKRVGHIDVVSFLAVVMVTGALVSTVAGIAAGSDLGSITSRDLVLAFIVALIPGTLGHAALAESLKVLPANIPPIIKLAIPPLSAVMAWYFLGQPIEFIHVAGGSLLIVGVAGALRSRGGRALMDAEEAGHFDDIQPALSPPPSVDHRGSDIL